MTSPVLIVRRNNRKTPSGTGGGGVVISKSPIHGELKLEKIRIGSRGGGRGSRSRSDGSVG